MKQHKLSFWLIVLVFLLTGSEFLAAQISIDVKTKWIEKKGLSEVKHGVLSALDFAPEFKSVEFGEDYALWLQDLKRSRGTGDTIVLMLELELRRPSLFQQGELIAAQSIVVKYNKRTLDSIGSDIAIAETADSYQEQYNMINEIITDAVVILVPEARMIAGSVVGLLLDEINRVPNLSEIYEGTLVGTSVLAALEGMVQH